MRYLPVLLLALWAAAPHAQTAEHVELVDAVIEASDIAALTQDMMGPMAQSLPGGLDATLALDAVEDSMRVRLISDGRTDALREVLTYLESPANATLTAHGLEMTEQLSDPAEMAAFQARVAEQEEGTLADEALVRRYERALGTSEFMPKMMARTFEAMAQAIPEFKAMMESQAGEMLTGPFGEENMEEFAEAQVAAMRVALYGVPRDVLEEAIAFAESDAGQYYTEVGVAVATDVMIPAMVEMMKPMLSGLAAAYASEAGDPEVFDVAEVQPELIGGYESLADAIVYPEDARSEGVEGRVIVQFVVDTEGAVTEAVAVRSPDDRLTAAALAAVRDLRFTPGQVKGRPVPVRFSLPVTFRLPAAEDDE